MKKKYLYGAFNLFIFFTSNIIFYFMLSYIDILSKYNAIYITIFIFLLIFLKNTYFSHRSNIYNIGMFICFFFNCILIFQIYSYNIKYDFLNNFLKGNNYTTYNVVVFKKNTGYNNIFKLNNKSFGFIQKEQKELDCISYNLQIYPNLTSSINALNNAQIQSLVLDDKKLNILKIKNPIFYSKIRIIYSFRGPNN